MRHIIKKLFSNCLCLIAGDENSDPESRMKVKPEFFDGIVRHWTDKQKAEAARITYRLVSYYAKKNPEIDKADFVQTAMLAAIKCRKRYGNDIVPANLRGYIREGINRDLLSDKAKMLKHDVRCGSADECVIEFISIDGAAQDHLLNQDSLSMLLYADEIEDLLTAEEYYVFRKVILQGDSIGDCYRDLNPTYSRSTMEHDFTRAKGKVAAYYRD